MRKIEYTSTFKQDYIKVKKHGKSLDKLYQVMSELVNGQPLAAAYNEHALKGWWEDCRELQIEPDWLLIYRLTDKTVRFERTGYYLELFF